MELRAPAIRRSWASAASACAIAVFVAGIPGAAAERLAPTRREVASGVFVFTTPPYGDVGLDGNSVAIVTGAGVVVFDTNGTPAASAEVLRQIRALTPQPVRYVVNSHWHWDHWYGTQTYTAVFPGVEVIAHEKTRALMAGAALEFNRPGLERDLPAYLDRLAAKAAGDPALRPLLEEDRFFYEQKKTVRHVRPTLTYHDRLTLTLGGREIQLLHYGRGVTPGDTFLYLPREKIVIAGDLLVNPISFALGCYPTEWLQALERIDRLDAATIVPGHGEPLHDRTLLHATMDVFRRLLAEGRAAKARGVAVDEAKAEILPTLGALRATIAGADPALGRAFDVQLVDWYLHRVYDELDGPLTDAIAPIPRS